MTVAHSCMFSGYLLSEAVDELSNLHFFHGSLIVIHFSKYFHLFSVPKKTSSIYYHYQKCVITITLVIGNSKKEDTRENRRIWKK